MNAATHPARTLPRYKCHKEVSAVKIASIGFPVLPDFTAPTCKGSFVLGNACGTCQRCMWEMEHGGNVGLLITPADEGYEPFVVSRAFFEKHKPEVGGYFVQYDDGYESFSPAKAFEDGYTRVEMNALELGAAVRAAGLAGK